MIEEVDVGLVGLPGGVQRADPELEQLLDIGPALRRHPISKDIHEAGDVQGLGEGHHPGGGGGPHWDERLAADKWPDAGGGVGAPPVLLVEGAPGGGAGGQRGGGCRGRRRRFLELRLLGEEREGRDGADKRGGGEGLGEEQSGAEEDGRHGRASSEGKRRRRLVRVRVRDLGKGCRLWLSVLQFERFDRGDDRDD